MPFDQSTYPYKNIHCYRCNINISTEIVTDIHYDMNNTGNGYIYYLFTLRCEEYFKLGTYDPLQLVKHDDMTSICPIGGLHI
jgi:hypothetical protein